jgi:4-diphosphocytidyl-2-C-methyl-D-erythritol kinase
MEVFQKAAENQRLSFLSPAKVNLFFRILHKRKDGYHEIASLYQAISLVDKLTVSLSNTDVFTCSDSSLSLGESNLVMQALSIFREKTGFTAPFQIHLDKKIPVEAGLGGGSSNAATALFAFQQLSGMCISKSTLMDWGALIGSDVPFFFSLGTAYATGRGEVLEEISPGEAFSMWIAKPSFGLSTPKVYQETKAALLPDRDPLRALKEYKRGEGVFYNDLEVPAFSLSPRLESLKITLLEAGFKQVVLSGSGTAFFCLGLKKPPKLPQVQFFLASTLQRRDQRWYEL